MERELGLAARLYFAGIGDGKTPWNTFAQQMHERIRRIYCGEALVLDTGRAPYHEGSRTLDHYFGTYHDVAVANVWYEGFDAYYGAGLRPDWLLAGGMNFGDIVRLIGGSIVAEDLGLWHSEQASYGVTQPSAFTFAYTTHQRATRMVLNPEYDTLFCGPQHDAWDNEIPERIPEEYVTIGRPEGTRTMEGYRDPFHAVHALFRATRADTARLIAINGITTRAEPIPVSA